ncbi:member of the major facilitator superfamily [Coprinopsis marcescibilis]|uniref:Member of the major facilitator superfamily n=1 Tax=Coprinopsis marcescibilis TaxID=230819 RepID=A0A5C3L478_COPMA|nr:member of the major facilitator superfamily [Coprinopsis marcescibilis]
MAHEDSALLVVSGTADNNDNERTYGTNGPSSQASASSEAVQALTAVISGDVEGQKEDRTSYLAVVAPMAIGIFLFAMDGTIVVSSYAAIGSELKELQSTSWIATSYLLTTTSFQPLYGKLSDIFGRKGCLLFAYTVFAVGTLLCGLSRNMTELIASRALAGIGGGGMQTVVSIIVSDVVPLRARGTWQGVLNMGFAVGNATGASLGGILADTIGWRWSFLLQVPIAILAALSVAFTLHLPKIENVDFKTKIKRVDFGGAITLIITVFLLLLGLDRGGNVGWDDTIAHYSLAGFVFFASLFAFVELAWAKEPLAPQRIIVNRSLIASYLVNFLGIASAYAVLFHIPLFFQAVFKMSASQASICLIYAVVMSLIGSLGGGLLMQSTGKYYWLTVVMYVFHLVGVIIVTMGSGYLVSSVLIINLGLMLSSVGNSAGITTTLISLIANAGAEDQAIATAVSYLFRSLGSVVGLSVGSTLVQTTLKSTLRERLSGGNDVNEIVRRVRESLAYLDELDDVTQAIVRGSYANAIQNTFWFSVWVAAACLVASLFIKEKPLPSRK